MTILILFSAFSGAALLNSWFYIFLIIKNANRSFTNKLLIALFALMSIRVIECLIAINTLTHHQVLLIAGMVSTSLLGPVGYAFVISAVKDKKISYLHYPFTFLVLFASIFVTSHLALEILQWAIQLQMAIYFPMAFSEIRKSSGDTRRWIVKFLGMGGVIWAAFSLQLIIPNLIVYTILNLIVSLVLYYMTYRFREFTSFKPEQDLSPAFRDYGKSIKSLIETEKLYLNAELNKEKLAKKLEVKPYLVSQVINQVYKVSFSEFVTSYRIEHAKNLLLDESQHKFTIEHIAFSSGFSSLSSFYKMFKDSQGITPAEFRKKHCKISIS